MHFRRIEFDFADESVAFAGNVHNKAVILRIVAESFAKRGNRDGQIVVLDETAVPNFFEKLFLGYDVTASFDQKAKDLEHSPVDRKLVASAAKRFVTQIDLKPAEAIYARSIDIAPTFTAHFRNILIEKMNLAKI
jgi:hypothetical protein